MAKEYWIKFNNKEFKKNPNLVRDKLTDLRFKDIEKVILPFLYNLSKSDEPYIHWPNRGPIIKAQIEKVLKLTRG